VCGRGNASDKGKRNVRLQISQTCRSSNSLAENCPLARSRALAASSNSACCDNQSIDDDDAEAEGTAIADGPDDDDAEVGEIVTSSFSATIDELLGRRASSRSSSFI